MGSPDAILGNPGLPGWLFWLLLAVCIAIGWVVVCAVERILGKEPP